VSRARLGVPPVCQVVDDGLRPAMIGTDSPPGGPAREPPDHRRPRL